MPYANVDRRDYLRIPDSIYIDYRVVGRDQVFGAEPAVPFDVTARFLLRRDLYQIELEANQLLRTLAESDPRLGSFLQTVNRRLDAMTTILTADEVPARGDVADDVTLGEGGISFRVPELLQAGTLVGLKLLFSPSLLGLTFFGEVKYSRLAQAGEQYVIGVEFLHRDAASRELLTRHILRRQARERRDRLLKDGFSDSDLT